jgi:hypothetical protein
MESQHMTQQVFADSLGLGAATLSSIFNGRTRPTINVVEAIKKKIPNISTDWLMFGTGDMYIQRSGADGSGEGAMNQDIFGTDQSVQSQNPMLAFDAPVSPTPQILPSQSTNYNSVKTTHPEIVREEVKFIDKPQRKVIEIRVFYDDQTWDTFVPTKK